MTKDMLIALFYILLGTYVIFVAFVLPITLIIVGLIIRKNKTPMSKVFIIGGIGWLLYNIITITVSLLLNSL